MKVDLSRKHFTAIGRVTRKLENVFLLAVFLFFLSFSLFSLFFLSFFLMRDRLCVRLSNGMETGSLKNSKNARITA